MNSPIEHTHNNGRPTAVQDTTRERRLSDLFAAASKMPPDQRPAFLQKTCAEDPDLLHLIEELLAQDELASQDSFLEPPSTQRITQSFERVEKKLVGHRLGAYEVREWIASGGMGSVYRAARVDDYEQEVAIKLIRAGLESEEVLARFTAERQVLAELNHSHIARLLDGGTTEDGRPYFVMEFISGRPISRYCDAEQLSVRQRVELLCQVCEAVHHAHEQGIVHRDLKPANVLITTDGTPKLTDFGLAKHWDEDSGQTRTGQILGTPSYMSPEQASGNGQKTGPLCDVYALGAILYELLTGRAPFKGTTWQETLSQVCTDDPVSPRRLQTNLSRDLETMCLKCLQKEPKKRYANAQELADDLQRYLRREPIHARPVGAIEHLYRWCRRKPLVAGLLATLIVVVASSFVGMASLWLLAEGRSVTAQREKKEADRHREKAIKVVDDMYTRLAEQKLGGAPGMQELQLKVFSKALTFYEEITKERPEDRTSMYKLAQLHNFVGQVRQRLGYLKEAEAHHRQAIVIWQTFQQANPKECKNLIALFHAHNNLAICLERQNRIEEVARERQKTLEIAETLIKLDPKDFRFLDILANRKQMLGYLELAKRNYAKAEQHFQEGARFGRQAVNVRPLKIMCFHSLALNIRGWGLLLADQNQLAAGEQKLREAHAHWHRLATGSLPDLPDDYRKTYQCELSVTEEFLADLLRDTSRPKQAESLLVQARDRMKQLHKDFPHISLFQLGYCRIIGKLGDLYHHAGEKQKAKNMFDLNVRLYEQQAKHATSAQDRRHAMHNVVSVLADCVITEVRQPSRAVTLAKRLFDESPSQHHHKLLGTALLRVGKWNECIPYLEKAFKDDPMVWNAAGYYIAIAYWKLKNYAEARRWYEHAVPHDQSAKMSFRYSRRYRKEARDVLGLHGSPSIHQPR